MGRSAHPAFLILAMAGGWLGGASSGRAEAQAEVAFQWSAPEGCPSVAEVRREIDGLLGGPIEQRARADWSVRATVLRREQWAVTLETRSGAIDGHRTLESATCQGLASATALIVALMIDPDAVAAHASQGRRVGPEPQPAAVSVAVPAAPFPPPRPRTTFVVVGLGAAAHSGVLPGADVGLGAQVGLVGGAWRLELRGAYGPREVPSDRVPEASNGYGKFRFWAATVAGCWLVPRARIGLGPCLDFEVGAVDGEGVGTTETTSATILWYGVGAGVGLVIQATPWLHFPIHADAIVPGRRPSYVFNNVDRPIFRPWPVGLRLSLAAEAQF